MRVGGEVGVPGLGLGDGGGAMVEVMLCDLVAGFVGGETKEEGPHAANMATNNAATPVIKRSCTISSGKRRPNFQLGACATNDFVGEVGGAGVPAQIRGRLTIEDGFKDRFVDGPSGLLCYLVFHIS